MTEETPPLVGVSRANPAGDIAIELAEQRLRAKLFGLPALLTSTQVGRFTILRKLGAGGMGVVYGAYDDELDRKVAIKLLRSPDSSAAAKRMRREARGLARLSHPNVVQIYEVGEHEGALYLAMEFIAGPTLREWIDDPKRDAADWRTVLELMIAAGRGLEAAHRANLVHRDFKPANVMLGEHGRVRVLDFGLVRGLERRSEEPVSAVTSDEDDGEAANTDTPAVCGQSTTLERDSILERSLTLRGSILGTPAYMAPEQHRGETCDDLADQFGFCVVLFEALFGQRPFQASGRDELFEAMRGREIVDVGFGSIPASVLEAVLRGLAFEREERWPNMAVLLDELEAALEVGTRRRGWFVAIAIAATLSLGIGRGLASARVDAPAELCVFDEGSLEGTWDAARRARLQATFDRSDLGFAAYTLALVQAKLDPWAEAWLDAKRSACWATQTEGQSTELLDRRNACLDRKRRELNVIVELLEAGSPRAMANGVELLAMLPELDACAELERLVDPFPLPKDPKLVTAIEAARDELSSARAHWLIGDTAEALTRLEALGPEIQKLSARGRRGSRLAPRPGQRVGLRQALRHLGGHEPPRVRGELPGRAPLGRLLLRRPRGSAGGAGRRSRLPASAEGTRAASGGRLSRARGPGAPARVASSAGWVPMGPAGRSRRDARRSTGGGRRVTLRQPVLARQREPLRSLRPRASRDPRASLVTLGRQLRQPHGGGGLDRLRLQ